MYAIEIKGLTKKFKDFTAVDALNLEINDGELFALLGVNGAGKTTTIKMLSCLLKPDAGDALLLGESIVSTPHKVKEIINVSPQETAVARNLTARENLELSAALYGINKKDAAARAQSMIDTFDLSEYASKKAKTLSGGTQRRLSIAMALISEPKVLFLDEPTLGLDVIARRELWSAVKKLKGKVTVILTTHYMEEAEELSDRIGIMSKGRLRAVGTAKALTESCGAKNFEEAFVNIATQGGDAV
ncbi:MAG: ABC transporter ATP-binding protein [Clostridiales bacterium]|nr:ABC transporter ATP-binding protein [Clostridiales bacterium]